MATAATDAQMRLQSRPASLFEPGRNCWRVSHAARAAFLIDADNYFSALTEAAVAAQRSLYIAGWDFHSRTRLRVEPLAPDVPTQLGDFLNHLAHTHRHLSINVLIWDFPLVFGLDREWSPLYGLGWHPHHRIHVRFDNTHPTGGSHHQKLVVIDDAIAFCGGIDLTCKRWDTSLHAASNPHRVTNAVPYPPMHDAMIAVDGDAAHSLGELFRERWQRATGDALAPTDQPRHRWRRWPLVRKRNKAAPEVSHPWPPSLPVDIENVSVAISRTQAPRADAAGVREIEALYLDMIGAARRTIYVENQYFTASKIADALAARLAEPEGPEVIVVLRELSHGWLEELTMQTLRTKLIEQLHAADRHQRLRVYCPFIEGLTAGTCIDVHAKLIVIDDDWLRIGSANLANRSMGLDTECDVTVEALGRDDVRTAIRGFRERLVAEHLGTDASTVASSVTSTGSLRAAIDQLQRPDRTLKPLTSTANVSDAVLSMISMADPEKPIAIDELTELFVPEEAAHAPKRRHPWRNLGIAAGVLLLLTLMWRYTPLADWATAGHIIRWARDAGDEPWVALAILFAYLAGSLVMFPRPLITLFAVLAFGPYWGFALALSGTLFAALVPFWLGRRLDRSFVRRIAGSKLDPIVKALRRKGLWAVTALRLVPLAPFIIANIVAGTIRIRPRDYVLGTLFGMLPGVLVSTIFSGQVRAGLEDGANVNYLLIAVAVLVFAAGIWAVRRWLLHSSASPPERR